MASRENFCCCSAKVWTYIVAWLHIVCSSVVMIVGLFVTFSDAEEASEHEDTAVIVRLDLLPLLVVAAAVVHLFMGVLLFVGNKQGRPSLLISWMVFMGIGMTILTVTVVMLIVLSGAVYLTTILAIMGLLLVGVFLIYVIRRRVRDIDAEFKVPLIKAESRPQSSSYVRVLP